MNRLSGRSNAPVSSSASRARSPLAEGILEGNFACDGQGGASVLLWNQWLPLLSDLAGVGRVLVITRNSMAVAGEYKAFPGLVANDRETEAVAGDGSLRLDFRAWEKAVARHEWRSGGHCYSVEAADAAGCPLHKVCLTPQSDFTLFLDLVRNHQAAGAERRPLRASVPQPHRPAWPGPCDASAARPAGLPAVLEELRRTEGLLELRVGNQGAAQTVRFPVEEIRLTGDWLFVSGREAGVHLHREAVRRAAWHTLPCCAGAPWRIRSLAENGRMAFELSGVDPVSAR
jgi:putative heme degradation protein